MVTYGPYGVLGDGYTVWLKTHETGPVSKTGHLAKTFGRSGLMLRQLPSRDF
jgi:hypothetical protein